MKMYIAMLMMVGCFVVIHAMPGNFEAQAAGSFNVGKPLVELDKVGNVGVNFAGYHASAGLGGLLDGDLAKGGLHAEAGTPHGQAAGAGLSGKVIGQGVATGGLYAGATAGGNFGAGVSADKIYHKQEQVISEKTVTEAPKVISEHKIQASPVIHRTIIEKTVIPNYVEKTIQVPSYVEKTIRVPTIVEKRVRVEAAPTVIEKTIEVPAQHGGQVSAAGGVAVQGGAGGGVVVPVGGQSQGAFYYRKPAGFRKRFQFGAYGGGGQSNYQGNYQGGLLSGLFAGGAGGQLGYPLGGGGGAGAAVAGGSGFVGGPGPQPDQAVGGFSATYHKQANPNLFNDIFNIPISALGAVNNLLNNISGRGGASFAVSKQVSTGASHY